MSQSKLCVRLTHLSRNQPAYRLTWVRGFSKFGHAARRVSQSMVSLTRIDEINCLCKIYCVPFQSSDRFDTPKIAWHRENHGEPCLRDLCPKSTPARIRSAFWRPMHWSILLDETHGNELGTSKIFKQISYKTAANEVSPSCRIRDWPSTFEPISGRSAFDGKGSANALQGVPESMRFELKISKRTKPLLCEIWKGDFWCFDQLNLFGSIIIFPRYVFQKSLIATQSFRRSLSEPKRPACGNYMQFVSICMMHLL